MRGTKPKPSHLKIITGNAGKRPINKNEAKPRQEIPKPPPELQGAALEEWNRVSVQLHKIGLLSGIDRTALGAYCQCVARWLEAERLLAMAAEADPVSRGLVVRSTNGNPVKNPLVAIAHIAMHDMMRFCAEFGMTPSSRTRIAVDPAKANQDDPASEFFA